MHGRSAVGRTHLAGGTHRPRRRILGTLLSLAGLAVPAGVAAQDAAGYPSRAVRMIIPYGPGTGVDVVARLMGEALSKVTGQPFVAEQRVGAAGTIATSFVANAPADGYTVLFDTSAHTSVPAVMQGLSFDSARDIAGVTTLIENPLILVTSRIKGYRTVAELVAAARAEPGKLNFASGGIATSTHISAEKFRIAAGFDAVHVPYKSTTDAITELMGGRIDFTYTALTSALAGVRDGRLVALAMSARRSPVLPDVPTIAEAGYPDGAYSSWLGMMVSAKTPRAIVDRLHKLVLEALALPEVQERLAKIGAQPVTMSPDAFDALRKRELVDNVRLVNAAGIRLQ